MTDYKPLAAATAAAANFVQDLNYNPVLRTDFFKTLNAPNDSITRQAIDNLMKEKGYKCTHADLSNGYKGESTYETKELQLVYVANGSIELLSKSLLVWQSMYEVSPITDVADPKKKDGTMHRIAILGSRTNHILIYFNANVVLGVQNKFVEDGTLSWKAESSTCPLSCRLAFTFDVSSASQDAAHFGSRILKAKLWGPGEPEPTDFTHQGRDWFDDIEKFNGNYYSMYVAIFIYLPSISDSR